MSNEKSRNLGGVDVFFVSNMFFLIVVLTPMFGEMIQFDDVL